jgi:hypothetical protein
VFTVDNKHPAVTGDIKKVMLSGFVTLADHFQKSVYYHVKVLRRRIGQRNNTGLRYPSVILLTIPKSPVNCKEMNQVRCNTDHNTPFFPCFSLQE